VQTKYRANISTHTHKHTHRHTQHAQLQSRSCTVGQERHSLGTAENVLWQWGCIHALEHRRMFLKDNIRWSAQSLQWHSDLVPHKAAHLSSFRKYSGNTRVFLLCLSRTQLYVAYISWFNWPKVVCRLFFSSRVLVAGGKTHLYLFFKLLTELLSFVLLVVVHDHHSCIDLPNGHVTGCKKSFAYCRKHLNAGCKLQSLLGV